MNIPWGAGSSYKHFRNCLQGPAVPQAASLPEAPQALEAHLGCCVWLWGSLFWAMRRGWRGSAGLTGWALGLCGEAEGPGLVDLLNRRPRAHPATAPVLFSENHRISKVGNVLGDHRVQPLPSHHLVSLSLLFSRINNVCSLNCSSQYLCSRPLINLVALLWANPASQCPS